MLRAWMNDLRKNVFGAGSVRGPSRRAANRLRLALETLEDRCTPSTITNANWSGYVIDSTPNSVSSVSGTWTVPAVTPVTGAVPNDSSLWVGIDGHGNNPYLEQIGTEEGIANGQAYYRAWFQMLPQQGQEQVISQLAISPGDSMTATVQLISTAGNQKEFQLTLVDNTSGQSFSTQQVTSSAAPAQSAEWVVEAPTTSPGVVALLPNFGTAAFSTTTATINGVSGSVNSFATTSASVDTLNMVLENPGNSLGPQTVEDSTSALTPSGGFSVAYDPQHYAVIGSSVYQLQQGNLWQYTQSNGWTLIAQKVQSFVEYADQNNQTSLAYLSNGNIYLVEASAGGQIVEESGTGGMESAGTVTQLVQATDSAGRALAVWVQNGTLLAYNAYVSSPGGAGHGPISLAHGVSQVVTYADMMKGSPTALTSLAYLSNGNVYLVEESAGGRIVKENGTGKAGTVTQLLQATDSSGRALTVWVQNGTLWAYNAFVPNPKGEGHGPISLAQGVSQVVTYADAMEGTGNALTSLAYLSNGNVYLMEESNGGRIVEEKVTGTAGTVTQLVQATDSEGRALAVWVQNGTLWAYNAFVPNPGGQGFGPISLAQGVSRLVTYADAMKSTGTALTSLAYLSNGNVYLVEESNGGQVVDESGAGGTGSPGTVTQLVQMTDSNGQALAVWVQNGVVWEYNAFVANPAGAGSGPVVAASTSDKAQITHGSGQSATVGTKFAGPLQVTVTNQLGKAAANVPVTFIIDSAGAGATFKTAGSPSVITEYTNKSGVATAPSLVANDLSGSYTVSVVLQGSVIAADFSETNKAGAPASLAVDGGANQSASVGTQFAQALQLVVKDKFGNVLPGVTVTFTAPGKGATGSFSSTTSLTHVTATTNAAGVATVPSFTAGTIAGSYTVDASVHGVKTSFNETNVGNGSGQIAHAVRGPNSPPPPAPPPPAPPPPAPPPPAPPPPAPPPPAPPPPGPPGGGGGRGHGPIFGPPPSETTASNGSSGQSVSTSAEVSAQTLGASVNVQSSATTSVNGPPGQAVSASAEVSAPALAASVNVQGSIDVTANLVSTKEAVGILDAITD